MRIVNVDPGKIRVHCLWSIYEGKNHVWYTIYADDHQIPGISDIYSPSRYVDEEPAALHQSRMVMFSHDLAPPHQLREWTVTRKGRISEKAERRVRA